MSVSFRSFNVQKVILQLRMPSRNVVVMMEQTHQVIDGINEITFYPLNRFNLTNRRMIAYLTLIVPSPDFATASPLLVTSSPEFILQSCVASTCMSCMDINEVVDRTVPCPFDPQPNRCVFVMDSISCDTMAGAARDDRIKADKLVHTRSACISINIEDDDLSSLSTLQYYSSETLILSCRLGGDMPSLHLDLVRSPPSNEEHVKSTALTNSTAGHVLLSVVDFGRNGGVFSPLLSNFLQYFPGSTGFHKSISLRIPSDAVNGSYTLSLRAESRVDSKSVLPNSTGPHLHYAVSRPFTIVQGTRPPPPPPLPSIATSTAIASDSGDGSKENVAPKQWAPRDREQDTQQARPIFIFIICVQMIGTLIIIWRCRAGRTQTQRAPIRSLESRRSEETIATAATVSMLIDDD